MYIYIYISLYIYIYISADLQFGVCEQASLYERSEYGPVEGRFRAAARKPLAVPGRIHKHLLTFVRKHDKI